MPEDDLETGRPRDAVRRSLGNAPIGPSQAITLFMSLMLVGLLVCSPIRGREDVRMWTVADPTRTVTRVFERNLWLAEAVAGVPAGWRPFVDVLFGPAEGTREAAIAAFDEVLRRNGFPRPNAEGEMQAVDPLALDGLRARRAFLLLDVGRVEEAEPDLQRLSARGHGSFVLALRRVFLPSGADTDGGTAEFDVGLAGDEWIGSALRTRLAHARQEEAEVTRLAEARASRVAGYRSRILVITGAWAAILVAGLAVVGAWLARNRPPLRPGGADLPPAWTFEAGYATAVRAAFAAIAIGLLVGQLDVWLDDELVRLFGGVAMGLPLVWLVRRRLLVPLGTTFTAAFGLGRESRARSWLPLACALVSVQWLGTELLVDMIELTGARSHWTETAAVDTLAEGRIGLALEAIVRLGVTPFLVELGARGLLYATLRRNYGAWQSALFSSLLFGAAQFASLPGLVALTWQGFTCCVAFEMSRSLMANLAAHLIAGALGLALLLGLWG